MKKQDKIVLFCVAGFVLSFLILSFSTYAINNLFKNIKTETPAVEDSEVFVPQQSEILNAVDWNFVDEDCFVVEPVSETQVKIVGFVGESLDNLNIMIPSTIGDKTVTEVADNAFSNNLEIEGIFIPETVERVGKNAFSNCTNLKVAGVGFYYDMAKHEGEDSDASEDVLEGGLDANFGVGNTSLMANRFEIEAVKNDARTAKVVQNVNKVKDGAVQTVLDEYAFYNCGTLSVIEMANSVTEIGYRAYEGNTSLTEITIPSSVTKIDDYAFGGCTKLASIEIPAGVSELGNCIFSFCSKLTSLSVNAANPTFYSQNNCVITRADNVIVLGCVGSTIPQNLNITGIRDYAFMDCFNYDPDCSYQAGSIPQTYTITIPEGITNIGNYAFCGGTYIENVYLPNTITSIGEFAFDGCVQLQYNQSDNGLYLGSTTNNYLALMKVQDSSVNSFSINAGCRVLYADVFENCTSLTQITIPANITNIGADAFEDCYKLNEVNISSLENWCQIGFATLYSNPLNIGHNLYLNNNKVETLEIPTSISKILPYTFAGINCLQIEISASVTSIGKDAFLNLTGLDVLIIDSIAVASSSDMLNMLKVNQTDDKVLNVYVNSNITSISSIITDNYQQLTTSNISGYKQFWGGVTNYCDINGHTFSEDYTIDIEATCEEEGSMSRHCIYCDQITDQQTIAATGHNYGDFVETRAATCTEGGVETSTCANCGATRTRTTSALGHNYGSWQTVTAATCTATGTQRRTCSRCGDQQTQSIAALGHSYGNWTTVTSATCTTGGTQRRTCSRCGNRETQTTAALGHNYSSTYTTDREATCTVAGERSRHCTRCSARTSITTIPALGHNYVMGTCSNCNDVVFTITNDATYPWTIDEENSSAEISLTGYDRVSNFIITASKSITLTFTLEGRIFYAQTVTVHDDNGTTYFTQRNGGTISESFSFQLNAGDEIVITQSNITGASGVGCYLRVENIEANE